MELFKGFQFVNYFGYYLKGFQFGNCFGKYIKGLQFGSSMTTDKKFDKIYQL